MKNKILLLGSGELGKEFAIAAQRLGQYVIATDNYEGAPAMQVAHEHRVIDMLDGDQLEELVQETSPDLIVPEIEAIRTEKFHEFEEKGYQVVPSAKAANFTMNRKWIRNLAAEELELRTAPYQYASSLDELEKASASIGFPCIVKPLMSSSGKGQSLLKGPEDVEKAWEYASTGGRGNSGEVIVEGFVNFNSEITLLTVTQKNGPTLYCPPIGHVQKGGDYQASWQPAAISREDLKEAERMAGEVTKALKGSGIWGVEFFIANDGVYFSELSPRPHDTGMVTLCGTQEFNEFELHLRAILGIPIPEIGLKRAGASAVILAPTDGGEPSYEGLFDVAGNTGTDVRIFGKPSCRKGRRMGVTLAYDKEGASTDHLIEKAQNLASQIKVHPS